MWVACFILITGCLAATISSVSRIVGSPSWIPFSTVKYTGHQTLTNGNISVELYWLANPAQDTIEFGVASQNGNTWLAIGSSDAGGMVGATIWLGYNKQGTFVLEDRFATTYGYPSLSSVQSSQLLSSYQTATVTAFTFQRSLSSCNSQAVALALDKPMWFIFAVGQDNTFQKHAPGRNGQTTVDLSQNYFANYTQPPVNSNTTALTLVSPPINLTSETTAYCYTYFDLHQFIPQKRHVIKESTVISHPFVHHIVGYFCESRPSQFTSSNMSVCNIYRPNGNDAVGFDNSCSLIKFAWARGGNDRLYPVNLGKPIGDDPSFTRHLMLEIHYNNPGNVPGQVDPGSGFNLTVTSNLRQYEVGMLTTGAKQDFIVLPPNDVTSIIGECGTKCSVNFPASGLTVISSLNHMHAHGKSLTVQHVRNGQELQRLPSINYFDYNFQSYSYGSLNQSILLPGDRIRVNCTYDTTGETNYVLGGYASSNEMCYSFIEYYPALPFQSYCLQIPDVTAYSQIATWSFQMYCPANSTQENQLVQYNSNDMPSFNALPPATCPANRGTSYGSTTTTPAIGPLVTSSSNPLTANAVIAIVVFLIAF
ncbi:DBH-like monooxygenase protein 1 [Boothiomyces sp. JEL0866]|nr:DBH-like monooxygenase protein 1 [Boothiomyces sp. JEL0866]